MTNFAQEFLDMVETFQAHKEIWDDELDIKLMQQEIDLKRNPIMKFPPRNVAYFSPSSVSSCPRELFLKMKKAKKDEQTHLPYQRRWTDIGTMYGTYMQRTVAFIEKHYEKITKQKPAFHVERTAQGYYAWEEATKTLAAITYKGVPINLFGAVDGILIHQETGTRVGMEIKSKQTSAAKTSAFSMKEPEESHRLQSIAYAIMHGLDHYLIIYGNLSKKNWKLTPEDYVKNPDLRVFHLEITEQMKLEVLDILAEIVTAVQEENPPKMNLLKWNFNNFKQSTALSLTEEEFEEVKSFAKAYIKSNLPAFKKDQIFEAFQELKELRGLQD